MIGHDPNARMSCDPVSPHLIAPVRGREEVEAPERNVRVRREDENGAVDEAAEADHPPMESPEPSGNQEGGEDGEEGGVVKHPRTRQKVRIPTREEWKEQLLTHVPFRSWCPWCVAARARSTPHFRSTSEEHPGIPVVYLDYFHMKSPGEGETYPAIVLREGETLILFALMLPHRRREIEWPARRMAEAIRSMGLEKVVVRADRENAMLSFI